MGMSSTSWGGALWHALFSMAMNYNDYPSDNKKQLYIRYFDVLGDMLPCVYCRDFYLYCKTILPITHYLDDSSIEYPVMYWLYLLKDLVNQKLIYQENECYEKEAVKIDSDNNLNARAKSYRKTKLKKKIFYTKVSPPYEQVVAFYSSFKSSCESNDVNQSLQSCRHIPKL